MPEHLDRLLVDEDALLVGSPDGISAERRDELLRLREPYAQWCDELAAAEVAVTLQHDDLHDANVLVDGGRLTVFDWSDASVAHPFCSLLVTLRSVARAFELQPGDEALLRLRDGYLEPWTSQHDLATLVHLSQLAVRVAKVGRALSWQRALAHLPPERRGEDAATVPGWLEELLEPDVT